MKKRNQLKKTRFTSIPPPPRKRKVKIHEFENALVTHLVEMSNCYPDG